MATHDLFAKRDMVKFLEASGVALSELQKPNNGFYIVQHDKSREYLLVKFNPREDNYKRIWAKCYELFLPSWLGNYQEITKSKRVRLREIYWEQHLHNECYFKSYTGAWLYLN